MRGVILAGGLGTRLYPLTHVTNKHLLPVYDKPMIYYPIQTLVEAGIKDIAIVASGPHIGHFFRVLKNGEDFGLNSVQFIYQERPDGGIADALRLTQGFVGDKTVAVILGDNCTDSSISKAVDEFPGGATIFLKKVSDLHKFGVPEINHEGDLIRIDEKPKKPKSDYAVTGLYLYDQTVWEKIAACKPSKRGQLEITDVNNLYIKNHLMNWSELDGFWRDAGSYETLYEVNTYWRLKAGRG